MKSPSPERWRALQPHLDRALELRGGERESFLASLDASEPGLASDLRGLLALEKDLARDRFLESGSPLPGLLGLEPSSIAGQTIGAYTVESPLGEGGMGSIWLARRSDGTYESKVAIKLVRPGLDSRQVLSRFESERQSLARMNHASIARVLDAGTAPDGRPFFVMEYVDGRALTDYCDEKRLPLRVRLSLFLDVCAGVQHAHRNGFIHRDLKPSNILVAESDGKPVPKIIDFGIAKAVGSDNAPALVTRQGDWIGTPAYMSPEQWSGTGGAVDTRTDVYALGIILHELLVGVRPRSARDAPEESDPPTARFAKLGEKRDAIASSRATDPGALTRAIRGDLNWIVLRAIEHDPDRRYESPAALAQDLERHLAGRPVVAGPPDVRYRAGKFVRRHRVGVALGVLALVSLVGFAIAMTVQSARIARERDRANQEAATAKRALQVLTGIFEVSDPSESRGSTVTAPGSLDRGAAKIDEEMKDEPLARAQLLLTVGRVYESLGLYDSATPPIEKSVAIYREMLGNRHDDTLDSIDWLGTVL